MKTHRQFMKAALAILPALVLHQPPLVAQGTAFTYQGRLNDGGNAPSGTNNPAIVPTTLPARFYRLSKF